MGCCASVQIGEATTSLTQGDTVRHCETGFRLVGCFDSSTNICSPTPTCRLKGVLNAALQVYFKELDAATLADITGPRTAVSVVKGNVIAARGCRCRCRCRC